MGGYLIFGACGGIGSAVTEQLIQQGHKVFLASRNEENLARRANDIGAAGYCVADVTNLQQVEGAFSAAAAALGALTGVAHCVGSILLKPAHLTSEAEFTSTLTINLTSAFYVVRCAGKFMSGGGSIVLFSSAAARIGLANHEAIAAAKAGVIGLVLSSAATYAARGLRINCIAPGLVQTELSSKITSNPSATAFSKALHPLGRLGTPDDIGALAALLLAPESSWITGQVFGVDGGLATLKVRTES
jgi:3-oxoacyl-[acyl-carrier protein] reductase